MSSLFTATDVVRIDPGTLAGPENPSGNQPCAMCASRLMKKALVGCVAILGLLGQSSAARADVRVLHAPESVKQVFSHHDDDSDFGNRLACASPGRLCNDRERVQCSSLGTTWSGGNARCRDDCSGYDVSMCVRATPVTNRERVRPADRDQGRWAGARCNDGTPFSFQVRLSPSGQSRTWVIGLEGGASCDDNRSPCAARPPSLTTTDGPDKDFSPDLLEQVPGPPQPLSGPFDSSAAENPTFADANHVWAHYCSSDFYSGATTDLIPNGASAAGWYFSGRHHVHALLAILKQRYGFDDRNSATKVLVVGQSAGGTGVIANADQFVAMAPRTALRGQLRLVLEGSWHADIDDPALRFGEADTSDRQAFREAYTFWRARSNVACEIHQAISNKPKGDCYLGTLGYRSVAAPFPMGLGLPTLVYHNVSDPQILADHNVFDPSAPAVATYETLLRDETNSVKWLFQPADRRAIGLPLPLQIMTPFHVITAQRYAFDYTTPVWRAGANGKSFRDMLTRFWVSRAWRRGERITFTEFDNLPPGAFSF